MKREKQYLIMFVIFVIFLMAEIVHIECTLQNIDGRLELLEDMTWGGQNNSTYIIRLPTPPSNNTFNGIYWNGTCCEVSKAQNYTIRVAVLPEGISRKQS